MTGYAYIQYLLQQSTAVKDLISSWKSGLNEYYMIFFSLVIPELSATSYKIKKSDSDTTRIIKDGILKTTVQFRTINFYRDSSINGLLPHIETRYTINNRAYTQTEAEDIAGAVFTALHDKTTTSVNLYCTIEAVTPPRDEQDNYNARITVNIKSKE